MTHASLHLRRRNRLGQLLALSLLAPACAHAPAPPAGAARVQAAAGLDAPGEAAAKRPVRHYVSSLAYRHYVEALLARNRDDLDAAASSLREALLFDPESAHLHTALADVFLRQGRVADAEEELRLAIALDPGHGPARVLAAQIAAAARRDQDARAHLGSALSADSDDADALRELVRFEVSRNKLDAAHAAAERLAGAARRALEAAASARHTEEAGVLARDLRGADWQAHRVQMLAAEAFVELARARAAARDEIAAADEFARASSLAPGEEAVLSAQAAFLESRRRLAEARELQLRVLSRRPDAPEALAALGRIALRSGDPDGAAAYGAKLRQLATEMLADGASREDDRRELAQAAFRLGIPLLSAQRGRDALGLFESGLLLAPNNSALQFYRAVALARTGRPTEAAEVFDQLAIEPPAGAQGLLDVDRRALALDARIQAALARSRAGQLSQALLRLRELLAEHPTEEQVGIALLEAFERAGKVKDAVALLAASSRQNPRSHALLFALATAQERTGDRAAALGAMRRLLALDPHHAGALNHVGYALSERGSRGELAEAEGLLRRASALRPDDGAIADSLGYCLLRLGRTAEALGELERANRLSPDDPVILSHLGDALVALGRRDEAAAAFRRALRDLKPRASAARADGDAKVEPIRPEIPPFDQRASDRRDPVMDLPAEPPDRLPDRGDAKVRDEIEQKLRSLTSR